MHEQGNQLSVMVVDDHELVRAGMLRLLEEKPIIASIQEAGSGEAALQLIENSHFDIVFMDIDLPGISGVETSDKLLKLAPETRIILVAGSVDGEPVRKLLNAGVRGCISKGSGAAQMSKAIERVMLGEQYLSPDVARQMAMQSINDLEDNPFDKLTMRESEIIKFLIQGLRNRQISSNLHISEKTVSTHRTRAFDKLQVNSTTELVRLAMRFSLLE